MMHWYFIKIKTHSYKAIIRAMEHDPKYDKVKVILLSYMTSKGNLGNLSYIAVEANDELVQYLKHEVPNVLYVLGEWVGESYKFYHAQPWEIEAIKKWVNKSIYLYKGFKKGDKIKIVRGLFKDFSGEIFEVYTDNTAKALLNLSFHNITARIPLQDVEKYDG